MKRGTGRGGGGECLSLGQGSATDRGEMSVQAWVKKGYRRGRGWRKGKGSEEILSETFQRSIFLNLHYETIYSCYLVNIKYLC